MVRGYKEYLRDIPLLHEVLDYEVVAKLPSVGIDGDGCEEMRTEDVIFS